MGGTRSRRRHEPRGGAVARALVLVVAILVALLLVAGRPAAAAAAGGYGPGGYGPGSAGSGAGDSEGDGVSVDPAPVGNPVDPGASAPGAAPGTTNPDDPTAASPVAPVPPFEVAPATVGSDAVVAGGAAWAAADLRSVVRDGIFPPALATAPLSSMRRGAFVAALAQLDRIRTESGLPSVLGATAGTLSLPDAPAGSLRARAVEAGLVVAHGGRFDAAGIVTGDDAARGVVAALGLRSSARTFAARLQAAVPGARTSYELRADQVYVRALGMRFNQPQGNEQLEFGPADPAKVADVAYMLARGTDANGWREGNLRSTYESFELPTMSAAQHAAIATGVHFLGYPYVWAGESEGRQAEGHGGFDCSGFVWRMLNGVPVTGGMRTTLRIPERTSMAMSARGARIPLARLRPGDVLFFHDPSTKARTPANNYHTGIYLGNGWAMHSSGGNGGPHIERMDGWLGSSFSWGRRILR